MSTSKFNSFLFLYLPNLLSWRWGRHIWFSRFRFNWDFLRRLLSVIFGIFSLLIFRLLLVFSFLTLLISRFFRLRIFWMLSNLIYHFSIFAEYFFHIFTVILSNSIGLVLFCFIFFLLLILDAIVFNLVSTLSFFLSFLLFGRILCTWISFFFFRRNRFVVGILRLLFLFLRELFLFLRIIFLLVSFFFLSIVEGIL
jgi:hypothetical protein